ncbi:hypothetical protein IQ265_00765 [Nodosilinea sp. LEGE 06152]|uniref:hypothetical protein n=1 Tax=Nodosilinea sp. LEGE 06152 TaxID=2777966 RepID=UPI00187E1CC7|nr:hypothetical protein [Nodosilinea sp. LEGE 06152]MBE9155379.1 hypothetical protein [Nodosilinea sp. LEGE 06152]
MTIDPVVFTLIGSILAISTVLITVVRSIDARFAMARAQITDLEGRLALATEQLARGDERQATREAAHWEMADYRINANKELIEHRTSRFTTELSRVHDDLRQRIKDIESYLDKTTDFTIRAAVRPKA